MFFALGLAIGGVAGANWSKIKPMLEPFLGSAADGFGDAYGDVARMVADRFEAFQDGAAERRHKSNGSSNGSSSRKRKRKSAAANGAEAFVRA